MSLLEKEEIQELGLTYEPTLCGQHLMECIHFPIKDRTVPAGAIAVSRLVGRLEEKMDRGEKVVVHCRMGIGRASLIAGAVLTKKGAAADYVIRTIAKARGWKYPTRKNSYCGWRE